MKAIARPSILWSLLLVAAAGAACTLPFTPENTMAGESPSASPELLPGDLPQEIILEEGGEVWALYLAVGTSGDPTIDRARRRAERRGYPVEIGRLECDRGAPEAFGLDTSTRDYFAVALYFETREDARLVADHIGSPVAGIHLVRTVCIA